MSRIIISNVSLLDVPFCDGDLKVTVSISMNDIAGTEVNFSGLYP